MEDLFAIFSCVVLPYLIGSIPFGLLLTRLAGEDNKKLATFTFALDATKGFIPVALALGLVKWYFSPERMCTTYVDTANAIPETIGAAVACSATPLAQPFLDFFITFLIPLLVVLGHRFPPWKGVKNGTIWAPLAGAAIALILVS